MNKKITAIVQARIGSHRLKGKVIKKINNKETILLLLNRLSMAKKIDKIIVAIPNTKEDDLLYKILKKNNYNVFRGSEKNVLKRYYDCAKQFKCKNIVRITGDCPLIDPKIVDKLINIFKKNKFDYVTNRGLFTEKRTFADGMDVEIFSLKSLEIANSNAISANDKEHVTEYFLRSDIFKKYNYQDKQDFSNLRITLDTHFDFKLLKKIFNRFKNKMFYYDDIISIYKKNKNIFHNCLRFSQNVDFKRLDINQKTWSKAKEYIAGGNMLFSKRPDIFLPGKWPSYFQKAKGCTIYSLDGKKYIDVSIMGIGTNILGYSNTEVDKAVQQRLKNGNMSTLNCQEEVLLAEKLVKLHPWSDQVRFARSGGEANAIAVRIARAFTKKNKIAFCGYHGWHDWYLAANLKSKNNLNEHLLPGLKTGGVHKKLKDTIYPFRYNDFNGLKKLLKKYPEIGIIKMEAIRNEPPKNNFLRKVRNLADKNNIVLIFDECTTGFRESLGGIHKKYRVDPDIMMLGKAIGNGYAITAVLGKKKIMNSISKTFISSTFWTESIGPTAAIATLKVMEKKKSWKYITNLGIYIRKKWLQVAKKNKVKIKIQGIPSLSTFIFQSKNHQAYKTYITQEMLKNGFLATTTIYVSISHTKKIINKYMKCLDEIFLVISRCERGDDIYRYLDTKVSETDFARLN